MTRREKALWTLVWRLPEVVLTSPERVMLAVAYMVIGSAAILTPAQPGSVRELLPDWVLIEWAVTFLLGGAATLAGMVQSSRPLERLGLGLTALGASTYAVTSVAVAGWGATAVFLVFSGIAGACVVRLIVSSAGRQVIRSTRHDQQGDA